VCRCRLHFYPRRNGAGSNSKNWTVSGRNGAGGGENEVGSTGEANRNPQLGEAAAKSWKRGWQHSPRRGPSAGKLSGRNTATRSRSYSGRWISWRSISVGAPALSVCIAAALVSLEAIAKGSRYRIRDIVVSAELAIVADRSRYLRSDLYANVSLYYQAIMAKVWSVGGRARII
jgi:hypothetical protein